MDRSGAEGRVEAITVVKTGGDKSMYDLFQVLGGEYCDKRHPDLKGKTTHFQY